MKKSCSLIFALLAFLITISCFCGFSRVKAFADVSISTSSESAYLADAMTGTVIYKKNEQKKMPIASMCKIMTLLLCFESIDNNDLKLDETITISDTAAGMGGSQVFLETNGQYPLFELIKSVVVASANDASVALAERISGSEDAFVSLMNKRAKELNMNNTCFVNCTGLPKDEQYSCAEDVYKMFSELLTHKEYFKFSRIWTDVVIHPKNRKTEIANTNKLIRFYEGCDCGKTGYTSEAGHCLVASAHRNGMRLISVVIKAPDSKTRFKDVSSMFNYGFANFVNKIVIDNRTPLDINVSVDGGKKDSLEVIAEKPLFLFSHKQIKRGVEIDFVPTEKIKAPVNKGDKVGELHVYENNIEIAIISVVANEDIGCKTYFDVINDIQNNWTLIN